MEQHRERSLNPGGAFVNFHTRVNGNAALPMNLHGRIEIDTCGFGMAMVRTLETGSGDAQRRRLAGLFIDALV